MHYLHLEFNFKSKFNHQNAKKYIRDRTSIQFTSENFTQNNDFKNHPI